MIDEIAALLLQAMTQACEDRGDGIVTAQDDDLTAVEIEGTFDLRGLALTVLGAMPKSQGEASVTAMVSIADGVSDASVQRINDMVDAITAALKGSGRPAVVSLIMVGEMTKMEIAPV